MARKRGSLKPDSKLLNAKRGIKSAKKGLWAYLFMNFAISMLLATAAGYLLNRFFDTSWHGYMLAAIPAASLTSILITFFMDLSENIIKAMEEYSIPASVMISTVFPFSLITFGVHLLVCESLSYFSPPSMPPHILKLDDGYVAFKEVEIVNSNTTVLKDVSVYINGTLKEAGDMNVNVPSSVFYISWTDSLLHIGNALSSAPRYGLDRSEIVHNFTMRLSFYISIFFLALVAVMVAIKMRKYRKPFSKFWHRLLLVALTYAYSLFLTGAVVSFIAFSYLAFSSLVYAVLSLLASYAVIIAATMYVMGKFRVS